MYINYDIEFIKNWLTGLEGTDINVYILEIW